MKVKAALLLTMFAIGVSSGKVCHKFLLKTSFQVNSKLLKHPNEVSSFSPGQISTYVQHVENFSRSSRSASTDLQCYDIYLPKITQVPVEVNNDITLCTAAYDGELRLADDELTKAKLVADTDSTAINADIIKCNTITDSKESLNCHSKQVSTNSFFTI